jgi:hypothetical protein
MADDPLLAFRKAHARYDIVRRIAYREALAAAQHAGLKRAAEITAIDHRALHAWRSDWRNRRHWTGDGGFAWDLISGRYRKKPRSFHAAIWSDTYLCGLVAGWLSAGHQHLTMHFLESAPDVRHPLRGDIAYLAFTAADLYGSAVGARRLVLRNPLHGVAERYEAMGFRLAYQHRGMVYYDRAIP